MRKALAAIFFSQKGKVVSQSGYNYKATPTITLKGQWLKELGFDIGDYVSITCENGKIVITPDTERAAIAEAEAAFMEREMVSNKSQNYGAI